MNKAVNAAENKSVPEEVFYYEHMDFTIAHEEDALTSTDYDGTRIRRTFLIRTQSFVWPVDRPEAGIRDYTHRCPYCDKVLRLLNVYSKEEIVSQEKAIKRNLWISLGALLICIASIVLWASGLLFWFNFFPAIGTPAALAWLLIAFGRFKWSKKPDFEFGSPDPKGELMSSRIVPAYNSREQHYIQSRKGR